MFLKSILMTFYVLHQYIFTTSLSEPIMKRSIKSFSIEGSSYVKEEYPFDGPLYESKDLVYFSDGSLHSVSWYCTPLEIMFTSNKQNMRIPYDQFMRLGDSDGISKSDKDKIKKTIQSNDKSYQVINLSANGRKVTDEEKRKIWPNGRPYMNEEILDIPSSKDGSKIAYRYFHTTVMSKEE
ncbi:uncharacterized protein PGTG_22616 [Puccinia graminis f. sp. tritici CRL 75-36-700-3]|uniref:Uncharacterized protein n=1 Tax=Puccinia graminis f. sp. tritici (strain CRL 75-36-700-3 / race SCCL) TaxID=418459 RepID=H6QV07_PUCGT|nr:uncharacterized protein PGTG_22616 [Puccinia graminis f. sp. tritici CRL 75-36-700-3]EHS62620.1 hypothetical protein PGTG_22616 [Puccinia graminis f. sp. tritici CRL 75-36-700-3]